MNYLRNVFTKKQILWLILSGVSLVLFFIVLFIGIGLSKSQTHQRGADRWDPQGGSAQISVFFSELASIDEDSIKQLNFAIDTALQEESLLSGDSSIRKRISAYSAQAELNVDSEKVSESVKAIGVGGDFFQFHPVKLLSGNYFDGADLMQDYVLLDSETAWKLYGSSDIAGQIVEIGGVRHVVSGVYERETGRLNRLAGNDEPTIFMSYESLKKNAGVTSISCFETIMPEPVNHFAFGVVNDAVSVEKNRFEVIDNSKRFKWITLMKDIKNAGQRSMNSKSVIFPFWENMARGMEDILMPICVLELILLAFVVINLIVFLIRCWIKREFRFKNIKEIIEDFIEKCRNEKKGNEDPGEGEYL